MNYRQLIAESWVYTQKHNNLIFWLGFIPALFTTTVAIFYMAYQFFAFKGFFENDPDSFFHDVVSFLWASIQEHISWSVPLIILAVIFGICYFFLPILAKAAAIQTIARNRNGQKAGVGTGLRHGIVSFLPLLEYGMIVGTFSIFSVFVEMSFVVRNLGPSMFTLLVPFFVLMSIVSLFAALFLVFASFYIVIDGNGVFESMKNSVKLVILNWKHAFLIGVIMLIIGARIVLQAVIVFLIPTIIVLVTGYIATITLPITGIIIGGVIGLIGLILAAYLNGVVDIFAYSVWTFAFLQLTSEEEIDARKKIESLEKQEEKIEEEIEKELEDIPDMEKFEGHKNL
ncbi:hypothetical protein KJ632_04440 [Patescibacteria group bacterium]|nr:hypothetical protein [Patescibacteria group bacterium]